VTFSVVMPTFTRNDVRANLPMWEMFRPEDIASYSLFMHGGKAGMTTSLGSSSIFIFAFLSEKS